MGAAADVSVAALFFRRKHFDETVTLRVPFPSLPCAAFAQPFNAYLVRSSGHGYVEVPHNGAFNFTTGFTLETWVSGTDTGACSSIAGKGYTTAWWIGVCGTTLRSYIKGTSSLFDGGTIPLNEFVHSR